MFDRLFENIEKKLKSVAKTACALAFVISPLILLLGALLFITFGIANDEIGVALSLLGGALVVSIGLLGTTLFLSYLLYAFGELIAETKLLRQSFVPNPPQEEEQVSTQKSVQEEKESPIQKSAQRVKKSPQTQENVTQRSAFEGRDDLTRVVLEDGITSIGDYAFYNCSRLSSIIIPNSVTEIGYGAFYDCKKLVNIILPKGISTIENLTFFGCGSLQSIVIPSSVIQVNDNAFAFCKALKNVYYGGSESDWEKIKFGSYNIALTNATRYYYSETEPTDTENLYWHYVDGEPTPW